MPEQHKDNPNEELKQKDKDKFVELTEESPQFKEFVITDNSVIRVESNYISNLNRKTDVLSSF